MATLMKENHILISQLEIADSFGTRAKGLLGRESLSPQSAMWIHRCNSIHTFFMKFSIDCVFVDRKLRVKAIYKNVKPGRLIFPVWGASSVFELSANAVDQLNIRVGDELYVGA